MEIKAQMATPLPPDDRVQRTAAKCASVAHRDGDATVRPAAGMKAPEAPVS